MNFHDIILPKFVAVFASGSPVFINSNILTKSGREVRTLDREHAIQRYLLKNCRLSSLEFEQFNSFFRGRRGSNFAFRFQDCIDFQATNQFIAKGDNKAQEFQLTKLYYDPVLPYIRVINKPRSDSLKLYIDGARVFAELNADQGVIKLPKALEQNKVLTSDFTFDVAVRFASDNFEYCYLSDGSIELSEIELLEVK